MGGGGGGGGGCRGFTAAGMFDSDYSFNNR